jgi:heterodisulfide reductase subunit A
MITEKPSTSVLVVGAGIAGMQAAIDLANMNHFVYLLDRSATIGGNMARLDKTFPTNDCSMCMISPRMVACSRHENIRIQTLAELHDLEGEPGRFLAHIKQHPRYVDEKVCIGCGLCVEKCPKKVLNEYNASLDKRKAIYFVYPQAIPLVPSIDTASCIYFQKGRCRACEKLCPVQAVCLDDQERELEITVGAVILATGYELGLVPQAGEYGHGRYANVVTGLEYERMLSATGPFGGHPLRPSDGVSPQRVAWIQCVSSRDSARNRDFCSSVCCMAAVKQSLLTREHHPESEATIFYMDIRAHGKDFDRYVLRARDNYGVRFVRSMLSQIIQNPLNQNLIIQYYDRDTLQHRQEEFDLVVLSAGLKPSPSTQPLIHLLGIETNSYGFITPDIEDPSHTSRRGIFVCGVLDGPKDIPESVSGASAAAASAKALLAEIKNTEHQVPIVESPTAQHFPLSTQHSAPSTQHFQLDEPPRIGVFVCHCGKNIAGVLPVEALRDFARTLPHVVVTENFLFTCSTQTQERIKEIIQEHKLNRVVVAACSPRTHEPLFQETLQQAGLNKYLFEMANIRDQCSWVHGNNLEAAVKKAEQLIRAAVARAALLEPFEDVVTEVVPSALIIGGGLAGMTAALNLADQGLHAAVVEKDRELGGIAREIHHTLEGLSPRHIAEKLALRVKTHRNISLYTESTVREISGGAGRFKATLEQNGQSVSLELGAVILATGGQPYHPTEYFYGRHPKVVTQLELEKRLFTRQTPLPQMTVMIQCVGSRNEEFPLCSRICCSGAVKNAILLMEKNPAGSVYVLYRDVRTFGFKEEYYRKARDLGVIFVKFEPESPPDVYLEEDQLKVKVFDPASQMDLEIDPDLLVLSTGLRPQPGVGEIGKMLKLPFIQEGFFMEAHPKLSPLDFSTAGVFLCGLAHSPRFMEESLAQAKGAAGRAAGLLLQKEVQKSGIVAEVERERCIACLTCVNVCPYQVPFIDEEGISVIDPHACQGCGICVSECPANTITFKHYSHDQMMAQILAACSS